MKKMNTLLLITLLMGVTLLSSCGRTAPDAYSLRVEYDEAYYTPEIFFEDGTGYVNHGFISNLPLLMLESDGESEDGMVLRVADDGGNTVDPRAGHSFGIDLQEVGHPDGRPRGKRDYFFTLQSEGGNAKSAGLLGLGKNRSWFLLGGSYDKSLLRNYIGYTLRSQVLKDAPSVAFCELLVQDGGKWLYEGVYLLVEGDKKPEEVVIRRLDHKYYQEGTHTVVADCDMGLFVLEDYWGDSAPEKIQAAGAALEEVAGFFHSGDSNEFLRYRDRVDEEAFACHFLINEYMANYNNMWMDTYTYNTDTGVLGPGPVLNFELAWDNVPESGINIRRIEYQNAPFYRYMVQYEEFLDGLYSFSKTNADYFDGTYLREIADKAVVELGAAQRRDWYRWWENYFGEYNLLWEYMPPAQIDEDEDVNKMDASLTRTERALIPLVIEAGDEYKREEGAPARTRQAGTYEQEFVRVKYYAVTRPSYVKRAIPMIKSEQEELLTRSDAYEHNTTLAILFFIGFFVSIAYVRSKIR